jgi:hypothetical protein
MTPENGSWKSSPPAPCESNAANVSDQDKRLIAEWLSGRKLDTDVCGRRREDAQSVCDASAGEDLTRPAWNGWGVD